MNTNNPLVGQFYFGFKQELIQIVAQVNRHYMMVEVHQGIGLKPVREMVPLAKLQGYKLYPTLEAAMGGGK
jgi:hypothetical protein